jgi:hypothetical protein
MRLDNLSDVLAVSVSRQQGWEYLKQMEYDVPHKLDKAIRENRCTIDQGKY